MTIKKSNSTRAAAPMIKACCRAMEERFEVLRLLREGAQGRVLLCKDRATGTLVACKTSLAHSSKPSKVLGRRKEDIADRAWEQDVELRQEIKVMRTVLHDGADAAGGLHILPVHSTFQSDDCFTHLVTPFCEEGCLSDKLPAAEHINSKPKPLLGKRQAAQVIASLARALAHCHSKGVVHRNVKLDNILLHRRALQDLHGTDESDDPDVLLADFGVSTYLSPGHTLSTVVGSPSYMAPEVRQGCYDQRADIWSLGVVLHVLLTGAFLPPSAKPHLSIRDIDMHAWDLLQGMCCSDPANRLSLQQVLTHPWIIENTTSLRVSSAYQTSKLIRSKSNCKKVGIFQSCKRAIANWHANKHGAGHHAAQTMCQH